MLHLNSSIILGMAGSQHTHLNWRDGFVVKVISGLRFKTSLRVKPFMCNACRLIQIKFIFIWKVLHETRFETEARSSSKMTDRAAKPCACVIYDPVGHRRGSSAGKSRLEQHIPNEKSQKGDIILLIFYMTLRVFPFQDALYIFVELRLVVLIAETF